MRAMRLDSTFIGFRVAGIGLRFWGIRLRVWDVGLGFRM